MKNTFSQFQQYLLSQHHTQHLKGGTGTSKINGKGGIGEQGT